MQIYILQTLVRASTKLISLTYLPESIDDEYSQDKQITLGRCIKVFVLEPWF